MVRISTVTHRILVLCVAALPGATGAPGAGAAEAKPNIVLVLADDMGHGHVGCLNPQSKIKTPNIDRLAGEGMLFTDAHSGSAVCSPTRYGLLTGRYAWRTRLVTGVLKPYDPPLIERERLTLPAMLKRQGYRTACVGKWHLGWEWAREGEGDPDFTRPIAEGPTTRGFDRYFGTDVPNYPPYCFIENDRTVGQPTARKEQQSQEGRPGPMLPGWEFDAILPALSARAEAWIGEQAAAGGPFFLYFPLTSPHEPIAPAPEFSGKSGMNALADFIIETDAIVGRVVAAVDRLGLGKNTLVIFTADNGSSMYTGGKELEAAGHRVSAGFRGYKTSIYEGGHRVPFIARWPGRITAGAKSGETICLTDMMATFGALVGADLPRDSAEDSFNVLPVLLGQERGGPAREATVHQSAQGILAIRQGPWKLIVPDALVPSRNPPAKGKTKAKAKEGGEPSRPELYNLAEDPAETKNVIAAQPDVAGRLKALLEKYKASGRSRE